MTGQTPKDLIDRLDELLEQERKALLLGDLEQVSRIGNAKETLIDALNGIETQDQVVLQKLQTKVERNQVLLDGALQGIRNVALRLSALRKIRRNLQTYDEHGRRKLIQGELDHKVEKRA